MRVLHSGRYGRDADDSRLMPAFLGSRYFLRGYGWSSLRCEWNENGDCPALEQLVGNRLLVGNVEVRFPIAGIWSRDLELRPRATRRISLRRQRDHVVEREPEQASAGRRRVGIGVRSSTIGFPLELSTVRALDAPARGWSFAVTFRPVF